MECCKIKIDFYLISFSNLNIYFPFSFNENNCDFSWFLSEYLFCCSDSNIISCNRIKYDFKEIKNFNINIEGENSNLRIINNTNYASLFYINKNDNSEINLYEYIIYPPTCQSTTKTILVFNDFEINLSDLIEIKLNNSYYIKFSNIPAQYGNLFFNGVEIKENIPIMINKEDNIIYFISTNNNKVNNFKISYNVYIEANYSSVCTIDLTILPCFHSCYKCSKSYLESGQYEHNCLFNKCNQNYYPSPLNPNNCYTIEEKNDSWYFDNITLKFGLCNDKCYKCFGPNNTNCQVCHDINTNPEFSHLYKGQCLNECPEGTYENKFGNYIICEDCYQNCKSCNQKGNSTNMQCDSCLENMPIIKDKNCYEIIDNDNKTFYNPDNMETTSCFQLFHYYIKEDSYECISSHEDGYFISNYITGILSKCHSDCKTCSQKYNEFSTNCDSCNNESLYLQDGNCVSNCSIGYYLDEKICKKCHENCHSCYSEPKITSNNLKDMQCIQCIQESPNMIKYGNNCFHTIEYTKEKIIFNISEIQPWKKEGSCLDFNMSIRFGEYECKPKPENTFYVLENDDNTGIIKDCNTSCSTCFDEGNLTDTNCINCALYYAITEESNSNCILESLIPKNYYKNEINNIYYKCYENCFNCTEKYNKELNDMHCDICVDNYYFIHGTNNCYNMSFLIENKNYYFSETDEKFYPCYLTCSECLNKEPNEENNYCTKCINNYYLLENTSNCYDISMLENGYYLVNFTLDNDNSIFRKCYNDCKTCNNFYINNDMNCILCKEGLYKLNGTNSCYNLSLIDVGYYFIDNIFYFCEENCLTCSKGSEIIFNNDLSKFEISKNCLSCDNKNKGLYLVEDSKNCENINYTLNGYYLHQNENGVQTFKKCYKNCKLCNEGIIYNSSTQKYIHNCLECADGYFPKKNDLYKSNCYGDEMLDLNYTLKNNEWKLCHDNCYTCYGKPIINNEGEIIDQNCIKCIDNYHLMFNSNNCYNDSILQEGYYLSSNNSQYFKCHISCKLCFQESDKCLQCNNEQGYYLSEKKSLFQCFNTISIGRRYILIDNNDILTKSISIKKWIECYQSCDLCYDPGNNTIHNCINCSANNYFIYNTTNCISHSYASENGYYFDSNLEFFLKCDKSCLTCEENDTYCLNCNEALGYYQMNNQKNKCFNSDDIQEGYYLDRSSTPFKWKECYEKCEKCHFEGNDVYMRCISCKKNYINPITNKTVYLRLYQGNCIEGCENDKFKTPSGECVSVCPNNTYKFIPTASCLESCPSNYELNSEKTECIEKKFVEEITKDELTKQILSNISAYIDSSTIINGSDFIAIILSSDDIDPQEQIKKGISAVDLGTCITELKNHYRLSNDENIIILEMESKVDAEKSVTLEVYDNSGQKLDLTICKTEIKIMKYIGDEEGIDIPTAMEFAEQGIDVFNAKDNFFNDICHPFNSKDGTDIVLSDRRKDIYQNVSFCQDGCSYNGMNYDLMTANCICDATILQGISSEDNENNEKLSLSNIANSFTQSLLDFNFNVITCYNLVFMPIILKNNYGFFSMFAFILLQLFLFFIFLRKRLKPIRYFMYVFEPFEPKIESLNPPPKTKKKIRIIYDSKKEGNDSKNNDSKKGIKKPVLIGSLIDNCKTKREKNGKTNNKIKDIIFNEYSDNDDSSKNGKGFSRNKSSKNDKFEIKTNLNSIKLPSSKLNDNKVNNIYQKTINFYPTYKKNVKNYEHIKIKHKNGKNILNDIFSPINNIQNIKNDSDNANKLVFNSEREKIFNSETILNEKNNIETFMNNKNSNIKSLKNRIKLKSEKEKIFNKSIKYKEKNNTIKETSSYLNKDDKIEITKKDSFKDKMFNFSVDDDFQDMDYYEALDFDKRSFLRIYWSFLVDTQIILGTFFTPNFLHLFIVKLSFLLSTFQISFFLNALFYTDEYIQMNIFPMLIIIMVYWIFFRDYQNQFIHF